MFLVLGDVFCTLLCSQASLLLVVSSSAHTKGATERDDKVSIQHFSPRIEKFIFLTGHNKNRISSSPRLGDCDGGCGEKVAVGCGGDGGPAGRDRVVACGCCY